MDNVKKWLTGSTDVNDSEIINLNEVTENGKQFEDYKIIKWHHDHEIDDATQLQLLGYVENGGKMLNISKFYLIFMKILGNFSKGSLFCGSTPWGYLQIYTDRNLTDMCLHNFLKNYTGIIFTPQCLSLPDKMEVSKNMAKYSNLETAIEKIKSNPKDIEKYLNTIQHGIEFLDKSQINEMKTHIMNGFKNSNMNFIPSEAKPVCDSHSISATKMICKCYVEGEKAQGIKEFPG